MDKRAKQRNPYQIDDIVVVNPGVLDPDLGEDIGGWQGRVFELDEDKHGIPLVSIEWDSVTLSQMSPEHFIYCERNNLDWSRMALYAHEASSASPRDTSDVVKRTQRMLHAQYCGYADDESAETNADDFADPDDEEPFDGLLYTLTYDDVREMADYPAIFQRGEHYYHSGNIYLFTAKKTRITAKVHGSSGDYTIEIADTPGGLDMHCSCPYEGAVCKHLVAVLLRYVEMEKSVMSEIDLPEAVRRTLAMMSQQELLQLLLDLADESDVLRRELLSRLTISPQVITQQPRSPKQVRALKQQIDHFFDELQYREEHEYGYRNYDEYEREESYPELDSTFEITATLHPLDQLEVYWYVLTCAEEIETEVSIGTTQVIEAITRYADTARTISQTLNERQTYISELIGLLDRAINDDAEVNHAVKGALDGLCTTPEETHFVIERLCAENEDEYADWIAAYYLQLGKDAEYLHVRQAHLSTEFQHLDLADYWQRQGEIRKARETLEGYVTILEEWVTRRQPDHYGYPPLRADGVLPRLVTEYRAAGDTKNLFRILLLQSCVMNPTLDLYRQLKELAFSLGTWSEIRPELIKRCAYNPETLAAIHLYEEDWDAALLLLSNKTPSAFGYSDTLSLLIAHSVKTHRPKEALAIFQKLVQRHIDQQNRMAYATAAQYAAEIKELYHTMLCDGGAWQQYIDDIRKSYPRRRALLEEFRGL